ncbi:MAG: hypothetical protein L3J34_03605 [Flavobacteriaceae bacterium]|nr:hypothetical protein [Flavobacteriaceae bacterium]
MAKVLALVHLKGATTKQYDNLVQDLTNAGQLKLKERPHHFASIKDGEILVVDIWESAEDFDKFGEIMVPLAKKNGIDAEAELFPLYNELD